MSKYKEQFDDNNIICPYCEYKYQPECEDYSEEPRAENCEECGKTFELYQSYSINHHAIPDCELNNEEHLWEAIDLRNGKSHDFCAICDKCRSIRSGKDE